MAARKIHTTSLILLLLLALAAFWHPVQAQDDYSLVLVMTYDDPLTPAMLEYIERGLRTAEARDADLVVLQLNTPGGSVALMNQVVQRIRASEIPVVVYVWPRGGMAGSAGVLITLAGHASAMAPETIIGAASPIGPSGEDLDETAAAKEKNALKATVESLMEGKPPGAVELAQDMIETARAVPVDEAVEVGVVDYKARNLDNLLTQLDGTTLDVNGVPHTLDLEEAEVEDLQPSFIEGLLQLLTNPNIVFLLITIGVQALMIELYTPGGWVAGFIGVTCLALAIYGLGVLPVNWFGLIFLATSFVLFILEVKAPTHGALTAAGVGTLIVGALVLFNSPGTPSFQRISIPVVLAISLVTALTFFAIVTFAVRSLKAPVRTGQESLVGSIGIVRLPLDPAGSVHLNAEEWSAELVEGEGPLARGSRVEVVQVDGVRLKVRPAPEDG